VQQTRSRRVTTRQYFLLLLLLFLVFAESAAGEMVNVLSLDASRNSGGRLEDFVGGSLYASFRNDLALNTNFGMGGTVSTDVNFLAPVSTLTSANLATANVLIWSQRSAPSAPEKSAIASFVNDGGSLMVISQQVPSFIDLLGGNSTFSQYSAYLGNYSSVSTPITDGAFGNITGQASDPTQPSNAALPSASTGFRLVLNEGALPAGSITGMRNEFGNAVSATSLVGLGRVAIFGDDNLFIDPNYAGPNAANRSAALNTFAWLGAGSVTAVPEPSSIALTAIAIIPIARRLGRKLLGSRLV